MQLKSDSFEDGGRIPAQFAFGVPPSPPDDGDDSGRVQLGPNRNPHLAWSDVPRGTRSFAITCHDPDVPSVGDDVNQEGRTVPADLARVDFWHWVLVDVPASTTTIAAGSHSEAVTPRGKAPGPAGAPGMSGGLQGINDYTGWFAGDADMAGDYGGYDGPCPPWNDERLHHYHFTVHALDVESLGLSGPFTGPDAIAAMEGHVLDRATIVGTYTLNPAVSGSRSGSA